MCFAFLKSAISAGLAKFGCQNVKYLKFISDVSFFGGQDAIKGSRKKIENIYFVLTWFQGLTLLWIF